MINTTKETKKIDDDLDPNPPSFMFKKGLILKNEYNVISLLTTIKEKTVKQLMSNVRNIWL